MTQSSRRLFVLVALLAFVAAACGGSGTSTTAAPATTTTAATTTTEEMTEEEMTEEEMTEEEMTEEEMTEEEMTEEEMTEEEMMGDVLEVAADEGDLGIFLDALGAAGIMDDFHGEGPFTLFIPTDEAFNSYLDEAGMSQEEVWAGAEMLQGILNYHIVNMMEDGDMVMGMSGESFTTASGEPLVVTVDGDVVMVGGATIERYDLEASNGVIHVIDTVLIPPTA